MIAEKNDLHPVDYNNTVSFRGFYQREANRSEPLVVRSGYDVKRPALQYLYGVSANDLRRFTDVPIEDDVKFAREGETWKVTLAGKVTEREGTKTSLGVTRGWVGSDRSMREALQKMSARYAEPKLLTDVSWLQWQ